MIKIDKKKRVGVIAGLTVLVVGLVVWINSSGAPDFSDYEAGTERKQMFFTYFLPLVQERNQEIRLIRQDIEVWSQDPDALGWWDRGEAEDLAEAYGMDSFDTTKTDDWDRLLSRVDIVPPSLALVQAANESAWGTSRFSREGNNFYGQWCFTEGCGMVPGSRDAGKAHEVASFGSAQESVERYIRNLNSHDAYVPLRRIRASLRDSEQPITGVALAAGLGKYSERGDEYIKELKSMIRFNKLTEYDQ